MTKLKQLDDVDTALTALKPSYERLLLAEQLSDLCLRKPGFLAMLDQQLDQQLVASRMDRPSP